MEQLKVIGRTWCQLVVLFLPVLFPRKAPAFPHMMTLLNPNTAKLCGRTVNTNCNSGIDSISLMGKGAATTPTGKKLIYVYSNGTSGFKVWKELNGNRILSANGLDAWAKALNADGKGQTTTNFTDASIGTPSTVLAGRVCPPNVYIDDNNKFTTGKCVYREVGQYSNHTVGRFSVSGLVGGEGRHTVSFAKRSERSMMGQCCSFILMRIKSLEMFLKT